IRPILCLCTFLLKTNLSALHSQCARPLSQAVLLCEILFVAGLSFVIGLERTFKFFFQRHKFKATSFFLGGVLVVLIGWPIIGVVLEIYGFFLLFRGFFPVAVGFIRRLPVLGSILNLPGISGFVDKVGESNNMV
uniref:Golgi transport 1Bb n=1 Tax=Oncorhynchus tshawytscha TaxID=74940 RepID=A0AAZ3RMV7_ONCTS